MGAYKVFMATAPGIRKNSKDDQELGEDAIGFASKGKYVVLWVADGAPGQSMIFEDLDFSPRVLAKYVGECFEETVFKNGVAKIPFDKAFVTDFINTLDEKIGVRIGDMHTKFASMNNVNFDDILEYQETPAKDDNKTPTIPIVDIGGINPDITAKVEALINNAIPTPEVEITVTLDIPEDKTTSAQLAPDTIYKDNHKIKASIKVFDFIKGKGKQKPVQESKNHIDTSIITGYVPPKDTTPKNIQNTPVAVVKVATDEPVVVKKADVPEAVTPIVIPTDNVTAPIDATVAQNNAVPPTVNIPPVTVKPPAPPKKVIKMNKTYGITWAVAFTGVLIDTEKKIGSIISIGDCVALFNPAEGYEVQIDNKVPASTTIVHNPTNKTKPDVAMVTVDNSQDIPFREPSAAEVKSIHDVQENDDKITGQPVQPDTVIQKKKPFFSIRDTSDKVTGTVSDCVGSVGSFFKKQSNSIKTYTQNVVRDSVDICNEVLYGKPDYSGRVDKNKGPKQTQLKGLPEPLDEPTYPKYKQDPYYTQLKSTEDNTQKKVPIGVIVPSVESSAVPNAEPAVNINTTQQTKKQSKGAAPKVEQEKQSCVNDVNNFRTVMDKTNKLFIKWSSPEKFNSYKIEHIMHIPMVYVVQNLNSMILMSDGVMAYNDLTKLLSESTLDNVWDKLKAINNKTDDDKTAIFFSMLE